MEVVGPHKSLYLASFSELIPEYSRAQIRTVEVNNNSPLWLSISIYQPTLTAILQSACKTFPCLTPCQTLCAGSGRCNHQCIRGQSLFRPSCTQMSGSLRQRWTSASWSGGVTEIHQWTKLMKKQTKYSWRWKSMSFKYTRMPET